MSERLSFQGTPDQAALAEEIHGVMSAQGSFFGYDTPIRQTLTNLSDFFAGQRKANKASVVAEIESAVAVNDVVFRREERDGEVFYVTSRAGTPDPQIYVRPHMFLQRLYEPEHPLPIDDISVVVTTTRPALTTIEPVFISDYWQVQAGIAVDEDTAEEAFDVAEVIATVDSLEATEAAEVAEVAEVAQPVVERPAPVVQTPALPVNSMVALPNGVQIDLRRPTADLVVQHGATLLNQLRGVIEGDALRRLVMFGSQVFPESNVASFGKNDLRRISEYLKETGEPLLDTQIIADVFYHTPRQADYETFRFALNYRLSREKDFEFVGIEGARLWSVRGLPPIGGKRLKAGEMGQITGYLEEGFDDSLVAQQVETIRSDGQFQHVLTFFEWEYGVLPFTRALAALLPGALLADQRTAVLRIELPQHYTATLAELRYPTGNRGGWLQGLDGLMHEYLVPGAIMTLARTGEPNVFALSYEDQAETQDRLLELDESKKTPKFAFANTSYTCVVDSDMLINQQRYGRLRNLKAFPMAERRKAEPLLDHVAETIGDPVGTREQPRYKIAAADLFVAMNVLRPISREYLDHLLKANERFEPEGDAWAHTPAPRPEAEENAVVDDLDDDEE